MDMPKYKEACGMAKIDTTSIKIDLSLTPEKKKAQAKTNKN